MKDALIVTLLSVIPRNHVEFHALLPRGARFSGENWIAEKGRFLGDRVE